MIKNAIYILYAVFFMPDFSFAQSSLSELKFGSKYYEAVDSWVAFPKTQADTSYTLGYIYIDQQAGFTFDYLSHFIVTENGFKKLPREFEESLKSRLSPNTIDVAILSEEQISELELPTEPSWLKFYKKDTTTVSYLKNIGYHYNHVGASELAIEPLLKAYNKDPHFEGLEFELAFAYNATQKYAKAIKVLERAIENNSEDHFFYRELGFAYKYTNRFEEAETTYKKGIEISDDDPVKAEMAVNMAQAYFQLRDKSKFEEWANLTRKYSAKGSRFSQIVEYFEQNWNQD
ncbi:hypothetical protein A8B79_00460 [Balneola sp. EhC07]|uniref:tetratricopeptide repeat protein n=1 Tax=Balneola sp. EhC07 TaxID=1849360 RepID=UPI0007F39F8B|nr:hypothetical protein [Balneola sp. EhC07]OAN64652.1 hypothetical protein A8B79_00460 [Balneola sp. EhC07]